MEVEPIRDARSLGRLKAQLAGGPNWARNLAILCLGINTGFRAGDLLALKVGDALDGRGRIRPELAVTAGKTGRPRRVPLNRAAAAPLLAWLTSGACGGAPGAPIRGRGSSPPSRQGGGRPLSRKALHHQLKAVGAAAGLPRIGTHSMRKTFG
ncbi:MAG: tyrosine-type recombinase/integrase [Deltaproteobacteria bacterium]|jgi:integrase|nr:tyrosine-type recombinase/integrase [Deltaproteobacteria bacterium]